MLKRLLVPSVLFLFICNFSCKNKSDLFNSSESETKELSMESLPDPEPLSQEFKSYWYSNEAEITSYKLEQARYGEMRDGTAVLIYVTEPFFAGRTSKS